MTREMAPPESLRDFVAAYRSDADHNDKLWNAFTRRTNELSLLRGHRDWFEERKFGFGDRAFHYMWLLILEGLAGDSTKPLELLEIGVFKGQVISLWSLIARHLEREAAIVGITPLAGKPPLPRGLHRVRMALDPVYRQDAIVGNLHHDSNFSDDIETAFRRFEVPRESVTIIRGLSQDENVWSAVSGRVFDVVYVDGGHRYEEVSSDLRMYSPLVRPGGYLVVDDAGFFEPGSVFFKGFEAVSRAAGELDTRIWLNVLNVGHNRVFQRQVPAR